MRAGLGTVLALLSGVSACGLTAAEKGDIRRWLVCEECMEGELARVARLGDRAVPMLAEALRGPPADRRANMRRQSEALYTRVDTSAAGRQRYVGHYESNYVATYQLRAVKALDSIGTPRAHAALVAALRANVQFRRDVQRTLGSAAQVSLSVAGDSQHAPVDSVLKGDLLVLVQDAITGQPLTNVRVEFRPDSGGGVVSDTVLLTDATGRATTRWQMGDSARVNLLRVVAGGRLERIRAFSHRPGLRLVFLVQPRLGTPGGPLTPPPHVAVQDAWGVTQTGVNQTFRILLEGTVIAVLDTLVGGEAFLSSFAVPDTGTAFRLRVTTIGAEPVLSEPFDVR